MIISEYTWILPSFKTQAGQFKILQEKTKAGTEQYYVIEESPFFVQSHLKVEIDNRDIFTENNGFRTYEKMINLNYKQQYLFKYVNGQHQSIQDLIEKARNIQTVPIKLINALLSQLLECLYKLHKLNILGRQFSTSNILECEEKIIMMDFGFCPDLRQSEFSYLYPPELDHLIKGSNQFKDFVYYTSKLDSWLLGAFLYHLVKLKSIRYAKRNEKFIEVETFRYQGIGICEFIQKLLTFNTQERLSFFNIYSNQYIQQIQLQRPIKEYLDFYEIFENSDSLVHNILKRDFAIDSDFESGKIPQQIEIRGALFLVSGLIQKDPESSQIPNSEERSVTKDFFYKPFSYKTSSFKAFWYYINYEQYRCYMLLNTAGDIVQNLGQKKLEIEKLASYILKKMCFLILRELIIKLQSNQSPLAHETELWNQFKQSTGYTLLIIALQQKEQDLKNELISEFTRDCQRFLNNERLDETLRNSLKEDQENNFSYQQLGSENFLRTGFRQMTICVFNFIINICGLYEDFRIYQYTVILKVVCCHLINRIFTIDLAKNFPLLKPKYEEQLVPDDINDFISDQMKRKEKVQQIQYLLDLYFYQKTSQ